MAIIGRKNTVLNQILQKKARTAQVAANTVSSATSTAAPAVSAAPATNTASTTYAAPANDAERRKQINAYISGLIADNALLTSAVQGSVKPTNDGKYLKIRKKVDWKSSAKITNTLTNSEDIYPGALIVVDENVASLAPSILNVPRGKVNVRVVQFNNEVISGRDSIIADATKEPSKNMAVAVDHAIDGILADFYKSNVSIPPEIVDKTETYQSYKEAELKMHASAGYAGATLKANYETSDNSCRSINIRDFSQNYYTVKAEFPDGDYSQLFGPEVTVEDLRKKIRNNALLFVDSVTYGRRAFYCSEIEAHDSSSLKSAEASYKEYASVDASKTTKNQDLRFKSWIVLKGGNIKGLENIYDTVAGTGLTASSDGNATGKLTTMDKIRNYEKEMKSRIDKYVRSGATIDKNTQGVILSFSTKFLSNNVVSALIGDSGSYITEEVIPLHPVQIWFSNRRDADRYISATWKEYRVSENGVITTTNRSLEKTKVKKKSKYTLTLTDNTLMVKDIHFIVWDREGDEIVRGGDIRFDAENNYYPSEEYYYVVYWHQSMKAEVLDRRHWDKGEGMEVVYKD